MLIDIFKQLLGRVEFIVACIFLMLIIPIIFALGSMSKKPTPIRKIPRSFGPVREKKSPRSNLVLLKMTTATI